MSQSDDPSGSQESARIRTRRFTAHGGLTSSASPVAGSVVCQREFSCRQRPSTASDDTGTDPVKRASGRRNGLLRCGFGDSPRPMSASTSSAKGWRPVERDSDPLMRPLIGSEFVVPASQVLPERARPPRRAASVGLDATHRPQPCREPPTVWTLADPEPDQPARAKVIAAKPPQHVPRVPVRLQRRGSNQAGKRLISEPSSHRQQCAIRHGRRGHAVICQSQCASVLRCPRPASATIRAAISADTA